MKNMSKHEKFTIGTAVLAVALLIISCCPGGYEEATGILQGIATGLLSGVVLLFVAGIKNREVDELNKTLSFYRELTRGLADIEHAYSTYYHNIYHGKIDKMTAKEYVQVFFDLYHEFQDAYANLDNIEQYNTGKEDAEKIASLVPGLLETVNDTWKKLLEFTGCSERTLEDTVRKAILEQHEKQEIVDFLSPLAEKYYEISKKAMNAEGTMYRYELEQENKLNHIMKSYI